MLDRRSEKVVFGPDGGPQIILTYSPDGELLMASLRVYAAAQEELHFPVTQLSALTDATQQMNDYLR